MLNSNKISATHAYRKDTDNTEKWMPWNYQDMINAAE